MGARHGPQCHPNTSQWGEQSRLGTPVGATGNPQWCKEMREAWGQFREFSQDRQERQAEDRAPHEANNSTHTGKLVSRYENQSVGWVPGWTLAFLWSGPSQSETRWLDRASRASWYPPYRPKCLVCRYSRFGLKMNIQHLTASSCKCFPSCFAQKPREVCYDFELSV